MKEKRSTGLTATKLGLYLFSGAVLLAVSLIRIRYLGLPLERDEGEYAYMGQLLLQGVLPYTEAYSMKFPGIYFVYAIIITIFGQTHIGIHLALLFTNIATAYLLFLLGKRMFDEFAGIVAGSSFLVMTLSPSVQGYWANSEHFVMLPAVGGILLMLIALEKESNKQLLLGGILLGCALLIKQHGALFLLFGFIYTCIYYLAERPVRFGNLSAKVGLYALGGLAPLALIVITYIMAGSFDRLWFWTIKYASDYASMLSLDRGIDNFTKRFVQIFKPNILIMLLSLTGISSVLWNKYIRSRWLFTFGFLIFSFLAITPGFYFRPHYFILLLPVLSLLAGLGASNLLRIDSSSWLKAVIPLLIILISLGYSFINQKEFLFKMSIAEASRATYGPNPFPESIEIAEYIKKNTDTDDKIAVLGSEPQIYFYSKRKAATGYLYMYPLMEGHKYAQTMQEEMINNIESSQPTYIVIVNVPWSWLLRPDSSKLLLNWIPSYIKKSYVLSGVIDILSSDMTVFRWGNQAKAYTPISNFHLYVFREKAINK